jgi:3-oxoacid CoA-transferase B subunit
LTRAIQEITPDQLINLGIGLPQFISKLVDPGKLPLVLSENGLIGMGNPLSYEDSNPYCMDAGGVYVDTVPGGSYVDSAQCFGYIRRGLVDISFLGAFQVAANGDLANWHVPGAKKTGMGGALEIAACAQKLIILMRHQDKKGRPKILQACTFPLTARKCVDLIITDQAVFSITDQGMILEEIAEEMDIDTIKNNTQAQFTISKNLKTF